MSAFALSAGKKAALATLGMFTGVGGAVAYQLDQENIVKTNIMIKLDSKKSKSIYEL